jgi:predicted lipoprotein with Yx(FWY)xxD motif
VGALAAVSAAAGSQAKVNLHRTSAGRILVNSRGFTVYAFTRDTRHHDNCQKIARCLNLWPPVVSSGRPIAGRGVKQSLLGTITLKNGKHQVTYNGRPLYTYLGDTSPHSTFYIDFPQFGGRWPAMNATGKLVR